MITKIVIFNKDNKKHDKIMAIIFKIFNSSNHTLDCNQIRRMDLRLSSHFTAAVSWRRSGGVCEGDFHNITKENNK